MSELRAEQAGLSVEAVDAMKAGIELDLLIERRVFQVPVEEDEVNHRGWRVPLFPKEDYRVGRAWRDIREYSKDIGAAWQIVEHLRQQKIYLLHMSSGDTNYGVKFGRGVTTHYQWLVIADTAPLAICKAALKAALTNGTA